VTFLVLAHRDVHLIVRLAASIRARLPHADVVTAYNGPLDAAELGELAAAGVRRVGSGERAKWGEYSTVQRILEGLAEIDDDHSVVLISGDSHPTPNLAIWIRRFASSGAHAALWGDETTDDPLVDAHLRYRWRLWHRPASSVGDVTFRVANAVSGWLGPWLRVRVSPRVIAVGVRSRPVTTRHAKGDQWFAISPSGRSRLQVCLADPVLRTMFAGSLIPDESFFHTIALLDAWTVWRTKLMFVSWPYPGAPSPNQLEVGDLGRVVSSSTPFARKVAEPSGAHLAQALDDLPDAELSMVSDGDAETQPAAVEEGPPSDR
jgi:hypothetical protein